MAGEGTGDVLAQVASQLRDLTELKDKLSKAEKKKDLWDKMGTLSTFLSTVVVAAVGLVVNHAYQERQDARAAILRTQEIQVSRIEVVQSFMTYLTGTDERGRLAAYAAIRALGEAELAIELAKALSSAGTVSGELTTLTDIRVTGSEAERTSASEAIDALFRRETYVTDLVSRLSRQPLTQRALQEALSFFRFDNTLDCSIDEARRMLLFLGATEADIVRTTADFVSARMGETQEVTIWINSYGVRGQYGVRFGSPDGGYFGSNETLFHLNK
jgi:hypothetical protein